MIRNANINDLERIMDIERSCFDSNEVINEIGLKNRILSNPEHTYVYECDGIITSYITYALSNKFELDDDLFSDKAYDIQDGKYIILLGLASHPKYKRQGYATKLLEYLFDNTSNDILLTCHDYLIPFYSNYGFELKGVSSSTFSNQTWYDMVYYHNKNS